MFKKIGVTGTRSGMTPAQKDQVEYWLDIEPDGIELHHGDCVGVDAEVVDIARDEDYEIICHPPVKDDLRAFCPYNESREAKSYFARNRDIVDECDVLLVVPFQDSWQSSGGTWYTHDYAIKVGKPLVIFYPDGTVQYELPA
jgi:hypothetical protein